MLRALSGCHSTSSRRRDPRASSAGLTGPTTSSAASSDLPEIGWPDRGMRVGWSGSEKGWWVVTSVRRARIKNIYRTDEPARRHASQ